MDRADFIRLLSPAGQALLEQVGHLDAKADVVKLVTTLRSAGHEPALVAAVLTQAKLRRRAKAKFGPFADRMLFTEAGLEQASRLSVAAIHAGRFRDAGLSRIADLGCGIGAESLAMASLDLEVFAFDIEEVTAAIATYNLAYFENAKVEQADVTEISLASYDGLFLDPARRDDAGRKFDPRAFSPDYSFVLEVSSTAPTGVKFGPGHPHEMIPSDCEAQWISVGGELVELSMWFGQVKREGVRRSALLIDADGKHEITSATGAKQLAAIGELGDYIYEPDNSVVRSHLISDLASQLDARIFAPEIAYLTADRSIDSPWVKGYRLIDNLTFDRKKLKAYLRERKIGILEIKKRGSDIVPEQLRKEMQLKGDASATLIVTRVGDAHRALVCEPLPK